MGTPGLRGRMAVNDQALLLYAGLVAQKPHSAGAIASILRDYFRVPAEIVQFQGQWFPLEPENVTTLGQANSELGRTVVAGSSVFVSQSKFRVRLGPLNLAQFVSFLPVGPAWKPVNRPHEVPGRPRVRLRHPARPPEGGRPALLPRLEVSAPPDARVDDVGHQRNAPERRRRGRPSGR